MNKIERVRAALAGRPVDFIPASFWFHFPQDQARGQASVKAHLDYYRQSNVDFLKIMNEHPYRVDTRIQSPADWRSLRPAPLSAPFYQEMLDELKQILDGLNGECLAIVTIFGPFASGNHTGDNQVTEHLQEDPQSVSQGLGTIAESLARFAEACVQAGASGIYYSAQGGEEGRFSAEQFEQYIKPHDLTVLNAVRDTAEFNLLHVCKDRIRLNLYVDYPSHAVNWAATKNNLPLKEGFTLFQRTVVGGMDDRGVLVNGSPEEVRDEIHTVIDRFGNQSLIIGADCTLPTDIDVSKIHAAVDAAHDRPIVPFP